jgi:peptidoglycan/LPS O-acetylase OafA/YrhL
MRRFTPALAFILSLCFVTVLTVRLHADAPVTSLVAIQDSAAVQGVWGDEGSSAWSTGAATVLLNRQGWADWRTIGVTLSAPTDEPLRTQISIGSQTIPLRIGQTARRVELLDRVADGTRALSIDSETRVVAGDRRALGVRIGDIRIVRMTQTPWRTTLVIALWVLPLYAAAVWMLRSGGLGWVAWVSVASVHIALLMAELAGGYAGPSLLLVSPWREIWSILMLVLAVWPQRSETVPIAVSGRRIGLDVLRSIAVLCVVVAHGLPLLFPQWNSERQIFRWFVVAGDVGVDIFFALSGFLIGAIVLRQLPQLSAWPAVRRFWARRWLRTLPAAYVSALVVWFIAAPRDVGGYLRSIFFVATVNPYQVPTELGFWWSLGAEEAFYLLAPLVLYVLLQRMRAVPAFVTTLVAIAATALCVRTILVLLLPADIAGNVSFAIYARLDSMMWGVLLALLRVHRHHWYGWIAQYGAPVGLVVGATGIMLLLDAPRWIAASIIGGHMATTIGAALLIPAMERWSTLGGTWRDGVVRGMALISYSVYLYHSMWEQRVHGWFGSATNWSEWLRNAAVYLAGTLVLALLSYRLVEVPVLRWRDEKHREEL